MIEERKSEIRRVVINAKVSGPRVFPHRFEWKQQEGYRPDMHHYPGECLRRLMHRVIEAGQQYTIEHQHRRADLDETSPPSGAGFSNASDQHLHTSPKDLDAEVYSISKR